MSAYAVNTWTVSDYIKVGLWGMPKGSLVGLDVTYRCNLRCRHCYFIRQNHRAELPVNEWLARFEKMQAEGFPFLICGWIGGEPLLRMELIEKGRHYFKSNIVFTNGTIPLPDWPEVTFSVSVHGTAEIHSQLTGVDRETYQRIKENASRPHRKVVVAFCVNRGNYTCIEAMLSEWSHTPIQGIVFEFYTPMKGEDDRLWLNFEERDRVIDLLISLKKSYGEFIHVSDRILRMMKSENAERITRDCPFQKIGLSLDPLGEIKSPCQLGPQADCQRCGCILPFYSVVLTQRRHLIPEFIQGIWGRGQEAFRNRAESHK
jgi:MoaA/NifB/PqqE/SkfB family radical SAM enzyme